MSEATSQRRRPVTSRDLLALQSVDDPQISLDGKQVAWVKTWMVPEENRYRSNIFITDVETGDTRCLTSGDGRDSHPRWSPDGRFVAFLTVPKRQAGDAATSSAVSVLDRGPQLCVIPAEAGDARTLTDLRGGVQEPVWCPDGSRLAFTTFVDPAKGLERNSDVPSGNDLDLYEKYNQDVLTARKPRFISPGPALAPPLSTGPLLGLVRALAVNRLHGEVTMKNTDPLVTTFSIVGYDPEGPAWGIAIASRFLAVGAQTCWGDPEAGVVVLQAHLNAENGPDGIALLKQDVPASEVIERLMAQDPHAELRQMAVIDGDGQVATYTGEGCQAWAGGVTGEHCVAQGNMLLGGEGCEAMVEHFTTSHDSLARRLVDALAIGDEVAGDSRGRQAAALYVIRPPSDERFDVFTEPTIDLRVDDHENPHAELGRLLDLYELIYLPTAPDERMPANELTVRRFQRVLSRLGYYSGALTGKLNEPTRDALQNLARMENYRKRISEESWLDRRLLHHLEIQADIH